MTSRGLQNFGGFMRGVKAVCVALCVGVVVSCGMVPGFGGRSDAQDGRAAAFADDFASLGELSPRRLDASNCGMFLWDTGAERRLVFFSQSGTSQAQMVIGGEERDFERVATGGAVFNGQFARQSFVLPNGDLRVELTIKRGRTLDGGQGVSDGVLKLIQGSGWEEVVAVGGVISCGLG